MTPVEAESHRTSPLPDISQRSKFQSRSLKKEHLSLNSKAIATSVPRQESAFDQSDVSPIAIHRL